MIAFISQLVIVAAWGYMLSIHTRRLLRLAQVHAVPLAQQRPLRSKLERVWWWLGRIEFWRPMQVDVLNCIQLTFMIFIVVWSMFD